MNQIVGIYVWKSDECIALLSWAANTQTRIYISLRSILFALANEVYASL